MFLVCVFSVFGLRLLFFVCVFIFLDCVFCSVCVFCFNVLELNKVCSGAFNACFSCFSSQTLVSALCNLAVHEEEESFLCFSNFIMYFFAQDIDFREERNKPKFWRKFFFCFSLAVM